MEPASSTALASAQAPIIVFHSAPAPAPSKTSCTSIRLQLRFEKSPAPRSRVSSGVRAAQPCLENEVLIRESIDRCHMNNQFTRPKQEVFSKRSLT